MKVLIAYGSRYGSTEEIATKLTSILNDKEIETTVLNLKKEKTPNLNIFDGIIVGSGVKITKWMKEPQRFLRQNRVVLNGKKLALFVSCMSVLTDAEYARNELLEKVMEKAGVKADLYEAFGPLMDLGENSKMGFFDKKIAQSVMMGLSKEQGLELDMKGRNDLRDWDKISEYANKFSNILIR
jgi:menaquinone-dependent protoporphyrinogen oxidase